jgi:hypothetical protein
VGGYDISIPAVEDMYFGDNFLHRGLTGLLKTGIGAVEPNTTTEMTVVVSSENDASANARFFGTDNNNKRFEIDCGSSIPKNAPRFYYRMVNNSTNKLRNCSFGMENWSRLWAIGYCIDSDCFMSLYDTAIEKSYNEPNAIDVAFYDGVKLILGSWANRSASLDPMICNIHSVRRYNRVLTAEEIAHNYEIDKARLVYERDILHT